MAAPNLRRQVEPLHYTASGLPDVWLLNGFRRVETRHGPGVAIEDADGLHDRIANTIVTQPRPFTPAELRFLRKHIQQSQAGLARILGISVQTVARWEKNATLIDPTAERTLRRRGGVWQEAA